MCVPVKGRGVDNGRLGGDSSAQPAMRAYGYCPAGRAHGHAPLRVPGAGGLFVARSAGWAHSHTSLHDGEGWAHIREARHPEERWLALRIGPGYAISSG